MPRWTKEQPKDGDRVFHCGHVDAQRFHFFKGAGFFKSIRPDNSTVSAINPWFILCDVCLFESGGDPAKSIRGDAIWKGNAPFVEEDTGHA
jgi:hypothetical protein